MRKETSVYVLLALTAIMIGSMVSVLPVNAFIHSDTSAPWTNNYSDTFYEFYGPHVDQLVFRMYADTDAMWTGMQLGQIDVCDWPLTAQWMDTFSAEPYLSNITMISAGGEAGYYQVDFNHNYHPTLGQIVDAQGNTIPPYGVDDPNGRLNPVYLNHTTSYPTYTTPQWWVENETGYMTNYYVTGVIPEGATVPGDFPPISASVSFRLAVGYMFNLTEYKAQIGLGFVSILTAIPSYMGAYSSGGYIWDACPGYPIDGTGLGHRPTAESYLANAKIKCDAANGWVRYWDKNNDGVAQQIEIDACKLRFPYRKDLCRKSGAVLLTNELLAENFTFIPGDSGEKPSITPIYQQCMLDKRYDMTTFGWINVGPDPDYLYDTYTVYNYWDDPESSCPNTADVNDTVLNDFGKMIKFNMTASGARDSTLEFQKRFWFLNAALPLASTNRVMSQAKWYTGGNNAQLVGGGNPEDIYRRNGTTNTSPKLPWLDFCNEAGYGSNSWFSELNGYPGGYLYGTGNMTMRYGWSSDTMPQHINPLVSEWYWDSFLIGATYDTMGYRDPYAKGTWKGDLAKSWQAGTWYDSVSHTTKSKVTVTIRTDAMWQDGYPVTVADVVYSLVEAGRATVKKGYAPPWWWPTGSLVKSLSVIDDKTVEILYDVQSYLVEGWTLGFYIIPKHIWKPIIDNSNPNPPNAFAPDPNLIGSGPFRYVSEIFGTSILMVANKAGGSVKTDLAGSKTVVSPGYHAYCPIHVNVHTLIKLTNAGAYSGEDPTGTVWLEQKPYPGVSYIVTSFTPNPGYPPVNQSAYVTIRNATNVPPGIPLPLEINSTASTQKYHVFLLLDKGGGNYELYLDWYSDKLIVPHAANVKPAAPWTMPTEFGVTIENLANVTGLVVNKYVYFDGVLQPGFPEDITLGAGGMKSGVATISEFKELFNIVVPKGIHTITVKVHIKGPATIELPPNPPWLDPIVVANPWISQWINVTLPVYTTIQEDIVGSTYYDVIGLPSYPYKTELTVPDGKVRVDDVLACATAFGSNPGDARWNSICDINHDYKVRVDDVLLAASMFGAG